MNMTKSLSSDLREVSHSFREKISHAEDKIDLMNTFSLAALEIIKKRIKNNPDIRIDDISLDIDSLKGFNYSERIKTIPEFRELLNETDIESQIVRLAEAARNRCKHIMNNKKRINLKIRKR